MLQALNRSAEIEQSSVTIIRARPAASSGSLLSAMQRRFEVRFGFQNGSVPACSGSLLLTLILLQKSFWGVERKFLEPLMRFTLDDVRDHIVSSKIDHRPSWRL